MVATYPTVDDILGWRTVIIAIDLEEFMNYKRFPAQAVDVLLVLALSGATLLWQVYEPAVWERVVRLKKMTNRL